MRKRISHSNTQVVLDIHCMEYTVFLNSKEQCAPMQTMSSRVDLWLDPETPAPLRGLACSHAYRIGF